MTDINSMRHASMEEAHTMLLEAMKYIDDICTKENIIYYAAYGTLLGAVREHGFIQWDYDADLWMKREDYKRFIEAEKKYHNPKYFLQTTDSDNGFFLPFLMRLCINDTSCWASRYKNAPFHTGFHVDIFPLDYGFGSFREDSRKLWALQKLHTICYLVKDKFMYVRSLRNLIITLMTSPLKILSLRQWFSIYNKIMRNDSPDKSVLFNTGGSYSPEREIFSAKLFANTIELPFEDMMIKCPVKYDEILTQLYGDYMTPRGQENANPNIWVKA
ncbi:MAG: LicD family protein [Synergistaceae bacterium]|nr:LicD family protein [Synergistaceae bacterium]MBR0250671.1 LicD family protein [Synergistaceae bacterium]